MAPEAKLSANGPSASIPREVWRTLRAWAHAEGYREDDLAREFRRIADLLAAHGYERAVFICALLKVMQRCEGISPSGPTTRKAVGRGGATL